MNPYLEKPGDTMTLTSNRRILWGILFEIVLIVAITVLPPLQVVFHTTPLAWQDYLFLCCIPPIVVAIEEVRKAWLRRHGSAPKQAVRRSATSTSSTTTTTVR